MQFSHYMAMHIVTRITGPKHNFLGVVFASEGKAPNPQIIEMPPQGGCQHGGLVLSKVMEQVLLGVAKGNTDFQTNYVVQTIHVVSNDTGPESVYHEMARALVGETKRFEAESQRTFRKLFEK